MGVRGIDYVYLETHDWDRSRQFWEALGFTLALDLDRAGRFVAPDGTAVFVAEIRSGRDRVVQLYLASGDESPAPDGVDVVEDWHDSHWDTRLLEVRDPDGRLIVLQHQAGAG